MPRSVTFLELAITLPDGWFQMKRHPRGGDVTSFLRFTEDGHAPMEPVEVATNQGKAFEESSYMSLTFAREKMIAAKQLNRHITLSRKFIASLYGSQARIAPIERMESGGRIWTCWEIGIPAGRFGAVEFLECEGYTLVERPGFPQHALWRISVRGASFLADSLRTTLSAALTDAVFRG